MIHFALKCEAGHSFESWFQSSDAYEKLRKNGMVACSVCGSTQVEKALMAPRLSKARSEQKPLSRPASEAEQAIAEMRRKVEESATYVGGNFAAEARAIHEGEKPQRPIYGEARPDEARALLEEGVPVLPLPFSTSRKTN